MEIKDLAKLLVSIPSWVDENTNEKEVGDFIFENLNKLPWLTVEKQEVESGRFNIVAYDAYPTKVLICDHIDTVQPQEGWDKPPVNPFESNGKLYGLGTSDSKGNVATVLSSLEKAGPTKGLMILFYIDEEYDFKGAKKFVKEYSKHLKPEVIASADGSGLEIGNACRGLIEIIFKVKGKSGHSARPESGINAITESIKAINSLEKKLTKFSTTLGECTTNLSWIEGGQNQANSLDLGKEGNVIPNFVRFGYELRNPNTKLNAKLLVKLFEKELVKQKLELESYTIRHDLGAWLTPRQELKSIEKLLTKVNYSEARTRGYVDLQMFWENFNKPTCFTFGIGEAKTAHKPNEYVRIDYLNKGVQFWIAFIQDSCSVQ